MVPSLLLSFREGLEAALIIGILLGTLKKIDRTEFKPLIWAGTLSAVVSSVVAGVIITILGASFAGQAEEAFEGVTMLLAAGMLTWVILWMQVQSRTLSKSIESDVTQAVLGGGKKALFALAFLAVIREGIELVLILTTAGFSAGGIQIILGASLGLGIAVVITWLLFKGLILLDLKKFFSVTSILLILFAAGLVAHGVHELNEAGWIPEIIEHVWDVNNILDEKSFAGEILKTLFGYNGNPSLTELIAYGFYFLTLVWGMKQQAKKLRIEATSYS